MNTDIIENQDYPIILSFDVGVIHLSYCLLTKKKYTNSNNIICDNWDILDWNNIDLTNREMEKCSCGKKACLIQTINAENKYYCKIHGKKNSIEIDSFENCFNNCNNKENICGWQNKCKKFASFINNECFYCTTHAKQIYKSLVNQAKLKTFKTKSSTSLNFDDVKYSLITELEKRPELLRANYVVIENQPSMKNPRMKSIASTLYDYYLIRGIFDKKITNSNITQVKFMSPSNKLKLASDGDTKQLIKAKNTDDTKAYKLTKSLGIKYCLDLISHLPEWTKHFNSFKKRDDLADSFLQGIYFTSNVLFADSKKKP